MILFYDFLSCSEVRNWHIQVKNSHLSDVIKCQILREQNMSEQKWIILALNRKGSVCVLQSDADSVCLICHIDLNQGTGGKTELQCSHTFHKEVTHKEWKTNKSD